MAATPTAIAQTQQWKGNGLNSRATWFEAADRNNDEKLSRSEFRDFRMNTMGRSQLATYRADRRASRSGMIDRSFGQLDRNGNGMISATEFANAPALSPGNSNGNATSAGSDWTRDNSATASRNGVANRPGSSPGWWNPDYVTATYFLTVTPVDTDRFEGQKVVNLKGDTVGEINRIVRTRDENRYYAMIDLDGSALTTYGRVQRTQVGVPLDDVLLFRDGKSVYLSTRGEEYLRDTDARHVRDPETVKRLYM